MTEGTESFKDMARLSVFLTPKAKQSLDEAAKFTGDTKTDTINRAITLYNLLLAIHRQDGGSLSLEIQPGRRERITIAPTRYRYPIKDYTYANVTSKEVTIIRCSDCGILHVASEVLSNKEIRKCAEGHAVNQHNNGEITSYHEEEDDE